MLLGVLRAHPPSSSVISEPYVHPHRAYGNKTTISYVYVQQSKLSQTFCAVDDPMYCCLRPRATVPLVSHSTSGVIVLTAAQKGMK